jgi:predicted Zn-ribbon and HTH transcriptional regulator
MTPSVFRQRGDLSDVDNGVVAFRKQLMEMLAAEPRTASSLARELQLDRRTMEDDLRHMIRSARAAGHRVVVEPARCRACGFHFDEDRLSKPGKCPECRGTWLFEPLIRIEKA